MSLHNLPEGLATFMAYLANPVMGVSLAVAVAIHNIPEGVCVAMPIYHATGSRTKGFVFGMLAGLSEPVGALIGMAIVTTVESTDLMYGILFSLVAGMMIYISLKELLPSSHRHVTGAAATTSLVAGMLVMAASLVLFDVVA